MIIKRLRAEEKLTVETTLLLGHLVFPSRWRWSEKFIFFVFISSVYSSLLETIFICHCHVMRCDLECFHPVTNSSHLHLIVFHFSRPNKTLSKPENRRRRNVNFFLELSESLVLFVKCVFQLKKQIISQKLRDDDTAKLWRQKIKLFQKSWEKKGSWIF